MSQTKGKRTQAEPPHRVLREVYRHYLEFRDYVAHSGESVIDHGYFVHDEDGKVIGKETITISFWDLVDSLRPQKKGGILSDRKREAVLLNVIFDQKQRDVAEQMEITTVSVGQYVEQAMQQLAKHYFPELLEEDEDE